METNPLNWVYQQFAQSVPVRTVGSICEWGKRWVKLPGSAMSKTFDPMITPWIIEPLDSTELHERRKTIYIKPIQSGGSAAGEVKLCHTIATKSSGDIQFNWQNDEQAMARWDKRVERILLDCEPVMKRAPKERHKWTKGLILFPHCNFIMQGVFTNRNVSSDSIKYQINEECHDEEGWTPGRLDQAFGRTTAFWDHSIFIISNAGRKGSELHQKYEQGTMQPWEIKCPGCGLYHVMKTEWVEKEPQLGGLRYDADGCRRDDGYDYNRMASTVRYQMPCGAIVHDGDKTTRRGMSLGGHYGAPLNPGASASIASYTLEAVSVDYINWLDLIMQKHMAIKSMKSGNLEPWKKYLRERECKFASDEDRPFFQRIVLSDRKKDRAGLPNRMGRFGELDRQQGSMAKGELPHWWGTIYDVEKLPDGKLHDLLVFEGKLLTDEDAADVMNRHEVEPQCVAVDSGDDTTHVYQFCLKHGFNAIKGSGESHFAHPDGKKIFSVQKPLHAMINAPPKYEYTYTKDGWVPDPREPMFWFYSKSMIRDRHAWLSSGGAGNVIHEIPSDVSADFKSHHEAEELQPRRNKITGEMQNVWVQLKERNDLYVCSCYFAMWLDIVGLTGMDFQPQEPNAKT